MAFIPSLAGEVSDFDPEGTKPEDVIEICRQAKMRLDQMGDYGIPLSQTERTAERIREEIETVEQAARHPQLQAAWQSEQHVHKLLRRLDELEKEAYDAFCAVIEDLEADNPLRQLNEEYREALRLKKEGLIQGNVLLNRRGD